MNKIVLTEKNFDEVIGSHPRVVIDFWAEWCGPCQSFMKVLDELAPKYPDFMFGNVDIEAEKNLADEFQIQSIPAVMIVRNKVVVFAESGALLAKVMGALLDQARDLDPKEPGVE